VPVLLDRLPEATGRRGPEILMQLLSLIRPVPPTGLPEAAPAQGRLLHSAIVHRGLVSDPSSSLIGRQRRFVLVCFEGPAIHGDSRNLMIMILSSDSKTW
jgi:hypothetical protein